MVDISQEASRVRALVEEVPRVLGDLTQTHQAALSNLRQEHDRRIEVLEREGEKNGQALKELDQRTIRLEEALKHTVQRIELELASLAKDTTSIRSALTKQEAQLTVLNDNRIRGETTRSNADWLTKNLPNLLMLGAAAVLVGLSFFNG